MALPAHVQQEFDKLSPAQQQKFHQLMGWGSAAGKGFASVTTDVAYFNAIDMIKRMGDEPATVIEPEKPFSKEFEAAMKGRGT